ncbi:hypothetical protein N0V94_001550 [Neodidymelliopsis sp. IMI 364377]|nr:hypothetical protein N0V94_001550 [Neodidymelliopsis sp. IMI 364377]
MLRGKGLTDWDWVYKTFPKWMLQEMDANEQPGQNYNTEKDGYSQRHGDRKIANSLAKEQKPVEREPMFAEPVIKTTHYERDEFGIVSPSDLRRPQEAPHVKVMGKHPEEAIVNRKPNTSHRSDYRTLSPGNSKTSISLEDATSTQQANPPVKIDDNKVTAKEASSRESSFIDAFFADESKVYDRDLGNSTSWRQTALQRRSASNVIAQPKARSSSLAKTERQAADVTSAPLQGTIVIPSSQALTDNYLYPAAGMTLGEKPRNSRKEVGWSVPEPRTEVLPMHAPVSDSFSGRPSSTKLDGLPKDDIDFLSAADIRAAMGTKKSAKKSSEEKKLERQKLESGCLTAKPDALDEVVEAHVVNNYFVRRTQQELERAQAGSVAPSVVKTETQDESLQSPTEAPQLESNIDRMRRWIEDGSASLSKHFWQDPIEAGAPSENDMQFAKQMTGLSKGRRAREHISDDLETDLPMSKGLLERLKNDENRVEHAVLLLRSPRKVIPGAGISKNLRVIRERRLRNTYERTEKQLESACQALRALQGSETVSKATNAFKRRLGIASRILHKNATLTRMLTWSAQARLDEPDLDRSKVELYSEILTRLATLRDTQLALARLMDHAIQTYGVSPTTVDEALSRFASTDKNANNEATVEVEASAALTEENATKQLADIAATAHLTDEIQVQKAAMQGLSDDGYQRTPKQTPRKAFEGSSPLAHSLFRPFSIQFESLSKETDGEVAAGKLKDTLKQKMEDKKLVQEVRSAYEDVYGSITVEHRQVPQAEEEVNAETETANVAEAPQEESVSPPGTVSQDVKPSAPVIEETEKIPDTAASSSTSDSIVSANSTIPTPAGSTSEMPNVATVSTESMPSESSTPISDATNPGASLVDLPTHYTILIHDPQTDTLSITTSTSGPPRDTSPILPIHQALSSLKNPAKFVPYITSGLEVVTAKRHMLVLRDALDDTSSTRGFETVSAPSSPDPSTEPFNSEVNPIDGTTRLSPTGYSGVEESQEQLERDFEDRRQAAATAAESVRSQKSKQARDETAPQKKKKKGSVGSVVKTAIWATTACYIVGVVGEVLR